MGYPWIHALRVRAEAGLRRFFLPFLWSLALFFYLAWMHLSDSSGTEEIRLAAVLWTGLSLSALFQLGRETLSRAFRFLPLASVPLAAVLYAAFQATPAPSYSVMYAGGISLASLAAGMYLLQGRAGSALFSSVFCGAAKAAGTAVLTLLCLLVCLLAADALLFDINYRWHMVVFDFAFSVVGVNFFLAWLPDGRKEEAVPAPFYKLTVRLFLPVYLVLLVILLVYVGKIGLAWELPVGTMNWFASLALLGYAFFYFVLGGQTAVWTRRFLRISAAALVPVIAAQLAGIDIRISAYGLTTLRYASLLCTAFGILVLVSGLLGRSWGRALCLAAAALLLFGTVTPWNVISLPLRDQQYRLQTVLSAYGMIRDGTIVKGEPLSREDRARLSGAYRYISQSGQKEWDGFTAQIAASEVLEQEADADWKAQDRYLRLVYTGPVPVEGWKTVRDMRGQVKDGVLLIETDGKEEAVPMGGYWKALLEAHRESGGEQEAVMVYDADGRRRLVFREASLWREDEETADFYVTGYILEK